MFSITAGCILWVLSFSISLVSLFDSTLLHTSSVWDLVRDHDLEKGQVPMSDNTQRIPNFPIVREQML